MNILIMNGSPSGNNSATLQFLRYMEKRYPKHVYETVNVGAMIHAIEAKENLFADIMQKVENADLVVWSFPVYVYMVPYNLKRFVELIFERSAEKYFAGKYTFTVCTSIHFFDTSACSYMRAICEDLDMRYLDTFSGSASDLEDKNRAAFDFFLEHNLRKVIDGQITVKQYVPVRYSDFTYEPGKQTQQIALDGKKVLIITDDKLGENLHAMVARLRGVLSGEVQIFNLNEVKINGGCLGCLKCTFDHNCVYGDKDDIRHIYNDCIASANIVIYAANIRDRFLSARWKLFMDRRFMNNHQPFLPGKQLGVMLSGPYSQLDALKMFINSEAEVNDGNLAAIITDEVHDSAEMDQIIDGFARDVATMAKANYNCPRTFLGISGKKIFRDAVYGPLRFVFQADHRYYKEHGWYDFPQNDKEAAHRNAIVMCLTKVPKIREVMKNSMKKQSLKPFENILNTAKPVEQETVNEMPEDEL